MLPPDEAVVFLSGAPLGGQAALLTALRFCLFGELVESLASPSSYALRVPAAAAGDQNRGLEVTIGMARKGEAWRISRSRGGDYSAAHSAGLAAASRLSLEHNGRRISTEEAGAQLSDLLSPQLADLILADEVVLHDIGLALQAGTGSSRGLYENAEAILVPDWLITAGEKLASAVARAEHRAAMAALGKDRAASSRNRLLGLLEEHAASILENRGPVQALAHAKARRRGALEGLFHFAGPGAGPQGDARARNLMAFEAAVREQAMAEAAISEAEIGRHVNREYRRQAALEVLKRASSSLDMEGRRLTRARELLSLVECGIAEIGRTSLANLEAAISSRFRAIGLAPEILTLEVHDQLGWIVIDRDGRRKSIVEAGAETAATLAVIAALRDQASPLLPFILCLQEPPPDQERQAVLRRQLGGLGGQVVLVGP